MKIQIKSERTVQIEWDVKGKVITGPVDIQIELGENLEKYLPTIERLAQIFLGKVEVDYVK